ncbi:hypothetical protein M514_27667 [Trichuris suis]|uniref:Uncharacterized protein n=1 Tax=Trichuris suis TaxID=68888 RepID=A0A085MSG8_9BILA|nr:hypothetical protein M514_27667 [Trichuris suis]
MLGTKLIHHDHKNESIHTLYENPVFNDLDNFRDKAGIIPNSGPPSIRALALRYDVQTQRIIGKFSHSENGVKNSEFSTQLSIIQEEV